MTKDRIITMIADEFASSALFRNKVASGEAFTIRGHVVEIITDKEVLTDLDILSENFDVIIKE